MHNVDLSGSGAQREDVAAGALRATHDVVSSSSALTHGDFHLRHISVLDGVDQGLAQTQELCFLSGIADVDAGGILQPDDGQAVTGAEGDELVHLHQALAIQLAADADGAALRGILRIVGDQALMVGDNTGQQAVDLGKTADDLGAVALLELHELAVIEQAAQDVADFVELLLVGVEVGVQILGLELGLHGISNAVEVLVVSGHSVHVLLQSSNDAFLTGINLAEEASLVEVDVDSTGRIDLTGVDGVLDDLLSSFLIDVALGLHAADDAGAADCHVGLLVSNEDGGADGVIAAASGVGAIDTDQHGDTQLLQLSMAIEGSTTGNTAGVDLLLLVQLNAGAVEQINQGDVQHLGHVGSAGQLQSLTADPGTGQLLVIRSDDHGPLVVDLAKAGDDAGRTVLVLGGVVQAAHGAPGALVHQQLDALQSGHLAGGVEGLVAAAGGLDFVNAGLDCFLDSLESLDVGSLGSCNSLADHGHVLEVGRHGVTEIAHSSCTTLYSVFLFGRFWAGRPARRITEKEM